MGARCIGCPPVGATCAEGILTLLPHYFRPAVQAGVPLGPDTELHPCYNSEACTLEYSGNASGAAYGCAFGYVGPLCGVCNAGVNYARFGEACALCWDTASSLLFLLAAVFVVLAVLTRVALRKGSNKSDAAIMLRITLGYLQGVGSLRVFRAGSTKAYSSVMGWTEVVSASPLSVGALQCILRLPYLFQYVATLLLPVAASVAVVAIFHAVTTGRSVHCRPRCSLDTVALKTAMAAWWATKRHLSTLLFVLFLAYMPIVSASLRALDCIDPVAGVRYLRSDLRVECGVGQHAAARALAYAVLIALGAGFPAGLAWLLGTARHEQLADAGFHATWGFLFDGYRAPTRSLAAPPPSSSAGNSVLGGSIKKLLPWSQPSPAVVTSVAPPALGGGDTHSKLAPAPVGTSTRGRRRSTLLPDRLVQTWVVSGDSRVWWEAVVLLRKAGVVLLAVTLTNPYLQCVGASLWFLAATALQVRYAPYSKRRFNLLETASLVATLLTAVISTALLQYNVGVTSAELHPPDTMTGIEWAVTVLLAVMNVGVFVVLAGLWLYLQCLRARSIVRRTSFVIAVTGRGAVMRTSFARRRSSAAVAATSDDAAIGVAPSRKSLPPPSIVGGHEATVQRTDGGGGDDAAKATCTLNPLRVRADAARPSGVATAAAAVMLPSAADTTTPYALPVATTGTGTSRRCVDVSAFAGAIADGALPPSHAASCTATPAPVAAAAAAADTYARGVAFAAIPVVRRRRP